MEETLIEIKLCINRTDIHRNDFFYTNRKDELLRNYERDLAKLRQAELLVAKKSEQVEELVVSPVNCCLARYSTCIL